jgi:23S rRNA (adenine2503-C2)-methyltransferase
VSGYPFALDLALSDWQAVLADLHEPPYRARQIYSWLYRALATSFEDMTDLPRLLRAALAERFPSLTLPVVDELSSQGGDTRKALLRLPDGQAIETVLMLYAPSATAKARRTICVSTQVGCALGCTFCATGQSGFTRNLTSGEIIAQVLHFARALVRGRIPALPHPLPHPPVTNIIFAGMGEPLANYDQVWAAVERLNDPQGFGLGARHLLISTAGLVPGIKRLAREKLQVSLAVSLHGPSDEVRGRLMPINQRYPLAEVLAACREYIQLTGRRVAFEYILIEGVNDQPTHARQLAALLQGMTCMVNLIPMNPVANIGFRAPSPTHVLAFQAILSSAGIPVTVRVEKGQDIQAACGQLRGRYLCAPTAGL